VTEINAKEPFWQAEPEHQDYLQRHSKGYSCHFVRPNWQLPWAHTFRRPPTGEGPKD
jgi:peptide-methionine (S)-S-oxide reductase